PEIARQVVTELIDQKVVAIIGSTTSGQAAAIFDLINEAKMVVISPGASSAQFSAQRDYFFRVVPTTDLMGALMARYMYTNQHIRNLGCIYDSRNQAYAEPLWQAIQNEFETLGGTIGQTFAFTSGASNLQTLMTRVKAVNPEAIFFIAAGIDVALMAQYGQQQGMEDVQLFSSPWAQSPELLEKGGQAVEGLELIAGYTPDIPYPPSLEFARRFETRYKRQPGLLASNGYESMLALTHALEHTSGKTQGLAEALTTLRNVEGAYSAISLDQYGDVKRPVYIARAEKGQFTIISVVSPAE
ncbi:ABC transporter substrate-binding protein, partial [candidate division KSB3 bacterium]|nr:ABC transporter substrate-binding protein [candidate division KSB3 bacterium]